MLQLLISYTSCTAVHDTYPNIKIWPRGQDFNRLAVSRTRSFLKILINYCTTFRYFGRGFAFIGLRMKQFVGRHLSYKINFRSTILPGFFSLFFSASMVLFLSSNASAANQNVKVAKFTNGNRVSIDTRRCNLYNTWK